MAKKIKEKKTAAKKTQKKKTSEKKEDKKVGRPSDYDKTFCDEAEKYLKECEDTFAEVRVTNEALNNENNKKKIIYLRKTILSVKLPTIESFALRIGVHRDTLYEWAKHHEEFSDTLTKIKTFQQEKLINGGLSGLYNPMIAKLILSSNHNMKERTEISNEIEPKKEEIENANQAINIYLNGNKRNSKE